MAATSDYNKLLTDKNLQAAFNLFDDDGNGQITIEELQKLLNWEDDEAWKEIVKEIDQDGDGEISFSEFKLMMGKLIN